MLNGLLWDADEATIQEDAESGRTWEQKRKGLLRMPMPAMFRNEDSLAGQLYNSFCDKSYEWACRMGLGGLATTLNGLF